MFHHVLLTDHEAKNSEKNLRAVVVVVWHGPTTILIELFGPIHYQWDRDASDKKYIDAIFVVVGTMLYGSTTALLNYLVPFIINGPGILPTRIEELVLDWSRIKVYRKWYKILEKLAFYDYIKKLIENQSLLEVSSKFLKKISFYDYFCNNPVIRFAIFLKSLVFELWFAHYLKV